MLLPGMIKLTAPHIFASDLKLEGGGGMLSRWVGAGQLNWKSSTGEVTSSKLVMEPTLSIKMAAAHKFLLLLFYLFLS